MKKINLLTVCLFFLLNNLFFYNAQSQIQNNIIVKVGEFLITSIDVQNEIFTTLLINKKEITQENIDNYKNFAVKNLIRKSIKRSEIKKYEIKKYNISDLQDYLLSIAKKFDTNQNGLEEIFRENNIDYKIFVENFKIELLWNTLIFQLYQNQTNINMVEVDSEIEKIKKGKTEEELKIIKKNILNQKKEEKFKLFSRSHFSNLENTININFL